MTAPTTTPAPAKKAPAKAPAKKAPAKPPAQKGGTNTPPFSGPAKLTNVQRDAIREAVIRMVWKIPTATIRKAAGIPEQFSDEAITDSLDQALKYVLPAMYGGRGPTFGKRVQP